jgi:hypothetical protein
MECDDVINGPELGGIFSIYMGLPSPACSGPIWQRLLATRKYHDPYGRVLHEEKAMSGDDFRIRHDQDGH